MSPQIGMVSNLGPHQMARHLRGDITAEILAQVNRRHITSEKLDAANRDIINRFRRCTLPRCWGDEKRAAADGTQYDLAEENLVSKRHIRYGGFGGIAYHHISDMYIALFSHFLACSVFEAIYIIDGLLKNTSELRPDTVHADSMWNSLSLRSLEVHILYQLVEKRNGCVVGMRDSLFALSKSVRINSI
jgi:TnpA family transposase